MKSRVFRRVHLADVAISETEGWPVAEREDGTRSYSLYEAGTRPVVLVERRDDFAADLVNFWNRRQA